MKARAWLNARRGEDVLVAVEVVGLPRERCCALAGVPHSNAVLRTTRVIVAGETEPRDIATQRIVEGA